MASAPYIRHIGPVVLTALFHFQRIRKDRIRPFPWSITISIIFLFHQEKVEKFSSCSGDYAMCATLNDKIDQISCTCFVYFIIICEGVTIKT